MSRRTRWLRSPMLNVSLVLALVLALRTRAEAQAPTEARIELKTGASVRLPLRAEALAPSGDRSPRVTSAQADEVLASDLQNSAVFAVTRAWDPAASGATPQFVVGGTWTSNGSNLKLEGQLSDF